MAAICGPNPFSFLYQEQIAGGGVHYASLRLTLMASVNQGERERGERAVSFEDGGRDERGEKISLNYLHVGLLVGLQFQ